jgi:mono/diheme cytochrome c family protein
MRTGTSQATLDCDQRRAPATRIVSLPDAQPSPVGSSRSGGVGLCRRTQGNTSAVVAGAKLYTMNCGSCHGINGRGPGMEPQSRP